MPTEPTIARIWRGRTRPEIADDYESDIKTEGIPPLEKTALGVQLFREDREHESWFTTISYWPDLDAMTAFTKGEPTKVHHLDRDPEFLIELPEYDPDPSDPDKSSGPALNWSAPTSPRRNRSRYRTAQTIRARKRRCAPADLPENSAHRSR